MDSFSCRMIWSYTVCLRYMTNADCERIAFIADSEALVWTASHAGWSGATLVSHDVAHSVWSIFLLNCTYLHFKTVIHCHLGGSICRVVSILRVQCKTMYLLLCWYVVTAVLHFIWYIMRMVSWRNIINEVEATLSVDAHSHYTTVQWTVKFLQRCAYL